MVSDVTMNARKQAADWRMSSSSGRTASRRADTFNGTLQPALLADDRMSAAKSSAAVDFRYDGHGAAVYVCAVISVYALFVVVFVAIMFAVRRRRRQLKSRHGSGGAEVDGARRLGGYLVKTGVLHDANLRIPPPPPPPPPPQSARLRSDSSSSASPVRRRSSRGHRSRPVAAGSRRGRTWHVDELVASPRGRTTNNPGSRRAVSASPIDDFITLIQVIHSLTARTR